jgi:hypothetical protein
MYIKLNTLFCFILYWFSLTCFAQEITLEKINTNGQILTGTINEKYNITIYLKVSKKADDYLGIEAYEGWYFYDNVKKKIPLVGIYNLLDGTIVLYNLSDKTLENKVKNLQNGEKSTMETVSDFSAITNFEEQFIIDIERTNSKWSSKTKEFKLSINETPKISNELVFLKLDKTTYINLRDLDLYNEVKIVSSLKNPNETKVLLEYSIPGNINLQGRCGGALDTGYFILNFSSSNEFISKEMLIADECYNNIYSEEDKSSNKNLIKIKISKLVNDKESFKKVTIDKKNISFIIEK